MFTMKLYFKSNLQLLPALLNNDHLCDQMFQLKVTNLVTITTSVANIIELYRKYLTGL